MKCLKWICSSLVMTGLGLVAQTAVSQSGTNLGASLGSEVSAVVLGTNGESGRVLFNNNFANSIGGLPEHDSHVVISGQFGSNHIGDNRALGITTELFPDPTGGGRSSEGINLHYSVTLPPTGHIATIEGYHVDFSGAWGPHAAIGLWEPTACRVDSVIGMRVRGVTIPAGADYVVGLMIDPGLQGGAVANYNIWSQGQTNVSRFDGMMNVYGLSGHNIGTYSTYTPGAPQPYYGFFVGPQVTDTNGGVYGSTIMEIAGSAAPAPMRDAYGLRVYPTFIEPASGVSADFVALQVDTPVITAGSGTVANCTTLKVVGAPTEGVTANRALWVVGGDTVLGGATKINNTLTYQGVAVSWHTNQIIVPGGTTNTIIYLGP